MYSYNEVKEFIESNNCILLTQLNDYIDVNHKLQIRCKCGSIYEATFSKFKNRDQKQCKKCGIINRTILIKMEYKDVKSYIESQGCNLLTSKDEYTDTQQKLKIKCSCGNIFYKSYSMLKYKDSCNCKKCGMEVRSNVVLYKQYSKIVNLVRSNDNDNCILLTKEDEYKSSKELTFLCQCGNTFITSLFQYKNNNKRQCSECSIKQRSLDFTLSNEEFLKRVFKLVKNEYVFLEEYIKSDIKIKVKHNVCGNIYRVKPIQFLNGIRCPKCQHRSYKKTTEEFKKEVSKLVDCEYEVLGEYVGNKIHIVMKHIVCNSIYKVTPNTFLRGCRCPTCNESKGEQKIRKWLETSNIEFMSQFTFKDLVSDFNNPLRFDFAVLLDKKLKYLIEYDGEGHYSEKTFGIESYNITKEHDKLKNKYCERNKIVLLRIPYWEYDKIEELLCVKTQQLGVPIISHSLMK